MEQETKLVPPTRDDIYAAMAGRGASVTLEPSVGGFYLFWSDQRHMGRTFYPRKGDIRDAASRDRAVARDRRKERAYQSVHDERAPGVPR